MDFQDKVRRTMNDVLDKYYKEDIEQLNERANAHNLENQLDKVQEETEKSTGEERE